LIVEKELLQNRILSLNKKNRALERDKKSKMYWISQEGLWGDRLERPLETHSQLELTK